jgi:hypothetical protein
VGKPGTENVERKRSTEGDGLPVVPEGTLSGNPKPQPATDLGKPEPGAVSVPGVAPPGKVSPSAPAADDAPEKKIGPGVPTPLPPGDALAQGPSGKPLPPLGAPPTSVAPAIVVPAPGSDARAMTPITPKVESFDEEVYNCRAGDNFLQISKQFYQTEACAQALLMYNRNHGQAAEGVRKDPPDLKPGDAVFIPPMRILEQRHPALIPGLTPLGAPSGQGAGVTARSSPAPTVQPVKVVYPMYRVVGANEGMYTIAQRALRDGMRWKEVARLNPSFNPSRPVPPNTILYLPADAQVPAENAWQQR